MPSTDAQKLATIMSGEKTGGPQHPFGPKAQAWIEAMKTEAAEAGRPSRSFWRTDIAAEVTTRAAKEFYGLA